MLAPTERYAVEKNGHWNIAKEGSTQDKAVISWLNNRELRGFLHAPPHIFPGNNQVERRSVRAVGIYRYAAFFKKSVEGDSGFTTC